ncbi:Wzz/FepE/Etk N-terminal domain-containing protein [Marinobacter sp. CHS3-4]|uniref:Wzz/FepE/Etk N-terminal domain-containing protein n=1 Tax=Marinobacter sp. CHS3-4 TaxID=3045174 RepID=UPI0024B4F672|nr:Wzz/FepE/Etk N-terminal domain-containing protein [Marinobacter sp. CHS3-4]MDI9244988.1 Wzz/FepE/Etk N-terminal domain-containing protein [Marinobacter sp. CHS3-4]
MSQVYDSKPNPNEIVNLRELFATLWRGKWIIIATTFTFAVGGVFYALSKPDVYQASVLLAPTQDEGRRNIGGQLGGLASLAGINIGNAGANQTVMAKEVLLSRSFLTNYIHRHELMVPLMATEAWDSESGKWVINREVYNPDTEEWMMNHEGESLKPNDWDLVKALKVKLSVSESKDTGMVSLSVKSQAPPVAKQWAEWLVKDINEHMRKQDVLKSEARIDYLKAKLSETNIADMRKVFYQLIENETRTVMLASAQQEYVFETVDPAVVPREKSGPKRTLIAIIVTILGAIIGILIVLIVTFVVYPKTSNGKVYYEDVN